MPATNPVGLTQRPRLFSMEFGAPHTCYLCREVLPGGTVGYHSLSCLRYEDGFYCDFCARALLASGQAEGV